MGNPLFEGRRACAVGEPPSECPYGARDPRKRNWVSAYKTEARERGLCGNCGTALAAGHVCDLGRILKEDGPGATAAPFAPTAPRGQDGKDGVG